MDVFGNPVQLAYDLANSTETVRDALGNPTTYEYDARGNVVTEINPLGGIIRRVFDENNNVISETDPLGYTSTYTYNSKGNKLTETDALSNIAQYTYNTLGQLLTSTDPLGNTTSYTYDRRGNLLANIDAVNNSTIYTYDLTGNLLSITEAANDVSWFEYDRFSNRIGEINALGNETTFTYDTNGNVLTRTTTLTTPSGICTLIATKTYDAEDKVTSLLDSEGNLTQFEYDTNGNQTAVIDALDRRTEYRYDEKNQLIETIYPDDTPAEVSDNLRTKTEYDAVGNRISFTDTAGRITRFRYDPLNRAIEVIYPDATPDNLLDNPRLSTEYNQLDRIIALVDERGIRTEYEYDAAGRTTIVRNNYQGHNVETTTTYDAAGRAIAQTDALDHTTRFVYDALGRLAETIFADGTSTKTTYDAFSNVIAKTDQAGQTTWYEYDALERLAAVVDAENNRTDYQYDEAGNLIYQKDANDHVTRFEYDGLGHRTAVVRPLGQRSETIYDAVGNVFSATDFNGSTIIYEYDNNYRLEAKHFIDEDRAVEVTYSSSGRPARFTDELGTTIYRYNEQDKLLSRTDPDGTTITYTYNQKGQIETVTTPTNTVRYTYDELGYLDTVTSQDGLTDYDYNAVGNLTSTNFSNGIIERRSYNDLNRLTSVVNINANDEVLSSYNCILDQVGNRTVVTELGGREVEYTYDELYRLSKEAIADPVYGNRTIEYIYDEVGNRFTRNDSLNGLTTYVYDDNDRLQREITDGVTTIYNYDNNGNVITVQSPERQVIYNWNSENRLIGADITAPTGNHNIQYRYNANGIRVATIVDGEETRYLVDANRYYPQILEDYKPGGEVLTSYTYGGALLSQNRNGESSFHLYDGYSGVRQLSTELGQVTDNYTYDAYGRLLTSTTSTENNYLYQGEQFDSNLGLQYLRARYYDPNRGSFLNVDPREGSLEEPMSRHRYIYGNNNPVTYIDPSGESAFADALIAPSLLNTLTAIQAPVVGTRALAIASGLAGAVSAIATAATAIAYLRSRTGNNLEWKGTLDITKASPGAALPGVPSISVGKAELKTESPIAGKVKANVKVAGLTHTFRDLIHTSPLSSSTKKYSVNTVSKDTTTINSPHPELALRKEFIGLFVFTTIRSTLPYFLFTDKWNIDDTTIGGLVLGASAGVAKYEKNLLTSLDWKKWETYDPFDLGVSIGISVPNP